MKIENISDYLLFILLFCFERLGLSDALFVQVRLFMGTSMVFPDAACDKWLCFEVLNNEITGH
ncbi:hypothetical protein DBR40_07150 [Pedobacter sp. KBW01]|nr:hypothetical protein DBR40_07150 [Pedobacter sp. KBW01]